ncbi:MAG: glycosyltransferase [Thaumarchaeota archaeon]|nr:glycosyltransferase [Nitrososphaerota archaeon]MCL5318559.1 glycosyltransferase [Nitrososphaerota archaeon]
MYSHNPLPITQVHRFCSPAVSVFLQTPILGVDLGDSLNSAYYLRSASNVLSDRPLISIIIPCKSVDSYAKECVKRCSELSYNNREIILLPDSVSEEISDVKIIPTGPKTPGAKRNIGVANCNGELCAFIDSDAYPRHDWLTNAVNYFEDRSVVAVGGPGLTPEEDNFLQKSGGYVLSSFMIGRVSRRYISKQSVDSDDIHSCNFIVKKDALLEVGGWNEKYWPGEDTLICLNLKMAGKKMVEAFDVIVYHHRRPLFIPHLKQVSRFGLHRGFFAKTFRGNSLKFTYFIPSFLVLSFIFCLLVYVFVPLIINYILIVIASYVFLTLLASLNEIRNIRYAILVWPGLILTHFIYGSYFIAGLAERDLNK